MRKLHFTNAFAKNVAGLALLGLLSSGCASSRMALENYRAKSGKPTKAIGIFTLRTENQYKPGFQPEVRKIEVIPASGGAGKNFETSKPVRKEKRACYEYLVSIDMEPGDYALGNIEGGCGNLLVSGRFKYPVDTQFSLAPGSIAYLGHVVMTNRKREEGERRSGGIFPLIDQAACGFSGGTFDVSVADSSEKDIPEFIQAYPCLKGMTIAKAIMQKRATVQGQ